jgi:hypothetical protein
MTHTVFLNVWSAAFSCEKALQKFYQTLNILNEKYTHTFALKLPLSADLQQEEVVLDVSITCCPSVNIILN